MRTFVLAAFLMTTSAFAAQASGNEAAGAMHSRLAAASASRTKDDVARVVDRHKGPIYALYARALRDNPTLEGTVVLSLSISPAGAVTKCTVASSTLDDSALVKRIVEHFNSIDFGAKGTKLYKGEYPITFISDGKK